MKDILDEELYLQKHRTNPFIINLFLLAVGIRLLGSFLKMNAWPFGSECLLMGSILIFIMGTIAFFTKAFYPPEGDLKITIYFLFFFIGFGAQLMRLYYLNKMEFPPIYVRNIGPFFELGTVLLLLHYYTRNKGSYPSIEVLKWPLILTAPLLVVGLIFKLQSWPNASEIITLSTLLFFIISIVSFFRTESVKKASNRGLILLNVAAANLFYIGGLFKIQSWPFASELFLLTVLFMTISGLLHLFKKKKRG